MQQSLIEYLFLQEFKVSRFEILFYQWYLFQIAHDILSRLNESWQYPEPDMHFSLFPCSPSLYPDLSRGHSSLSGCCLRWAVVKMDRMLAHLTIYQILHIHYLILTKQCTQLCVCLSSCIQLYQYVDRYMAEN